MIRSPAKRCGIGTKDDRLHYLILWKETVERKTRTFSSTPTPERLHAERVKDSTRDWQAVVREAAARAVGEDMGPMDLTSRVAVSASARAIATLVCKESCVLAGMDTAEAVFREVDGALRWSAKAKDGERIGIGQVVAEIEGSARGILAGERCALNFLQRLSGVATQTAAYVEAVHGTKAKILDTRKTTPGLRALERQAVRAGGGSNHRTGLYDGILIKENHQALMAPGGLKEAIRRAREEFPDCPLVVEADSVELAEKLFHEPLDRILLDNLSAEQVAQVVKKRKALRVEMELEASGGVTPRRAMELAHAGVEWISVGALTHSARAIDFSLDIRPLG